MISNVYISILILKPKLWTHKQENICHALWLLSGSKLRILGSNYNDHIYCALELKVSDQANENRPMNYQLRTIRSCLFYFIAWKKILNLLVNINRLTVKTFLKSRFATSVNFILECDNWWLRLTKWKVYIYFCSCSFCNFLKHPPVESVTKQGLSNYIHMKLKGSVILSDAAGELFC